MQLNTVDIILLVVILIAVIGAGVYWGFRKKKCGGCCGDCSQCRKK